MFSQAIWIIQCIYQLDKWRLIRKTGTMRFADRSFHEDALLDERSQVNARRIHIRAEILIEAIIHHL